MGSRACRGFVISRLILSDNSMLRLDLPKIRNFGCGVVSDNLTECPLGENSFPSHLRNADGERPHFLLQFVVDNEHCELRAALLAIGLV